MMMKIYSQEPICSFRKGGKGDLNLLEKNQFPNHLPLSEGKGIKKIELMRLPRHSVPRNDESEFLLP
jgi:hypothetical protein